MLIYTPKTGLHLVLQLSESRLNQKKNTLRKVEGKERMRE